MSRNNHRLDPIVAIGLLTRRDLDRLGAAFEGAIPIAEDDMFGDLLAQLDRLEVEPLGKGIVIRPGG
ncbi:hypothetical protein ACCC88_03195 [Sphingomonas sp. Sphisp140]|uniref:hypothetical protein n=1 Tax=unclassified Sphingomonas TaxID=196159 RepID=UPI0039AFB3C8